LEEKARMDEKLVKNSYKSNDPTENIEKSIAINDMYLEAIQAKLRLLDNI
jgi:hypothetical protein